MRAARREEFRRLLEAEGGPPKRLARYAANLDRLVTGLSGLGLALFLDAGVQAPIIATVRQPPGFEFERFYEALNRRGFVIYPGKLTQAPTFRIGCIGQVFPTDMDRLTTTVGEILHGATRLAS